MPGLGEEERCPGARGARSVEPSRTLVLTPCVRQRVDEDINRVFVTGLAQVASPGDFVAAAAWGLRRPHPEAPAHRSARETRDELRPADRLHGMASRAPLSLAVPARRAHKLA
jgi:hypothetical protein